MNLAYVIDGNVTETQTGKSSSTNLSLFISVNEAFCNSDTFININLRKQDTRIDALTMLLIVSVARSTIGELPI